MDDEGLHAGQDVRGPARGLDESGELPARRDVLDGPDLPDAADEILGEPEVRLEGFVLPPRAPGPASAAEISRRDGGSGLDQPAHRALRVQPLPEDLGDERHEGMEQAQDLVEGEGQDRAGDGRRRLVLEPRLDDLEVPVAELAPEELPGRADGRRRDCRPRAPRVTRRVTRDSRERIQRSSSARLAGASGTKPCSPRFIRAKRAAFQSLVQKARPELEALADDLGHRDVGHRPQDVELLARLRTEVGEDRPAVLGRGQVDELARIGRDRLDGQADVLGPGLHVADDVAHGVGAVFLDDVLGVDAVALALAHPLALAVLDVGVDEAVGERARRPRR